MTSLGNGDIFKSSVLNNGDSFVVEVEAKCDPSSIISQVELSVSGAPYTNGNLHTQYNFCKPTLDLEHTGMGYSNSGLYLQGNGVPGLGSPSSPCMSQSGLMSPSMVASEKMNGLSLEQMSPAYGAALYDSKANMSMAYPKSVSFASPGVIAVSPATKQFAASPLESPVTQSAVNGISRFGAQDMVMSTIGSNGMPPVATVKDSTSPVLSPNSSDVKDSVDGLLGGENRLNMSQRKQYFNTHQQGVSMVQRGGVADTTSFTDQVLYL